MQMDDLVLCDTGLLSSKFTEVIQLGAAHFTYLVYLDTVDVG